MNQQVDLLVKPLVKNVYYHFVVDIATRLAGLQTGEYHLADSMPYDNYEQLQNTDGVEAHVSPDSSMNMFYNKKEGIMSNEKMRQAVNVAIESDNDYLSSTLFDHYYRMIGVSDKLEGFVSFEGIIPWNVSMKEQFLRIMFFDFADDIIRFIVTELVIRIFK